MEALKWAVVTESQFTTAKHCVTCFDSKKEAIDWMNEEADAGNNAEVMLTSAEEVARYLEGCDYYGRHNKAAGEVEQRAKELGWID